MRLVDEDEEVAREVVDQRVRGRAGGPVVEDSRVVLDPVAEAELLEHLEVVLGPLPQPVRLEVLALGLEPLRLLLELEADLVDRALDRLLLGHVVRRRPDRDVLDLVEDLAGERVEVGDRLDLVAEQLDPVGRLRVGGVDLEHLALHPEAAAGEDRVVARVLHRDHLPEEGLALDLLPDLEQDHLLAVEVRRADPVDARDRGDDDHVAAREQSRGGGVAEPVDLVVDRRVLLDVEVLGRDVGLRLVVVVVGDEVLDRRLGEELAELVAELGGERLVVRDHERRAAEALDRGRHREGLAGAGGAEKRDVGLAGLDPLGDLVDRLRLVGGGRVGGVEREVGHRSRLATV